MEAIQDQRRPEVTDLHLELLRESVRARCRQSRPTPVIAAIVGGLFVYLLGVSLIGLMIWIGTCLLLLIGRAAYARSMSIRIDGSLADLERADGGFRRFSFVTQAVMGAGIWLGLGVDDPLPAYIITLLICLFGVAAMSNLIQDFRSVLMTIPVMMASPVAYWFLQDGIGIAFALALAGMTLLMIVTSKNLQRNFTDTISMRFEKDALLRELAAERTIALEAVAEADRAKRAKSLFLAAASHDLRQPLYAASLLRDTLALHDLPPEAQLLVTQQGIALSTLTTLFDDLLDLSRLESGVITPEVQHYDLRALSRALEAEFRPQCAAKGLALRVSPMELTVQTDPQLFDRLVRNLVSNAVRYTHEGHVSIDARREGDHVALVIADTGVGIAAEDHEAIFGEFVQLSNPARSRDRGVGLGLSIVRHVSKLLDHPLQLESEPGRGTTVSVKVPLSDGLGARIPPPIPMRGENLRLDHRVLLIENDPIVADAMRAFLVAEGCRVDWGASRAEIESLVATEGWPDFAILDDMLGDAETGLDIARWFSNHMDRQRLLIVTGNVDPDRLEELSRSGIAILRKPVPGAVLRQWIARVAPPEAVALPA
jgi:two-component system, sensor histidine kinase